MTIKVFPSFMPGEPMETHEWSGTFGGWLESKGIDHDPQDPQPIGVTVNGIFLPASEWGSASITAHDCVEIRPLPYGGVFKAIGSIIGKIFNLAFGWLMPRSRSNDYSAPQQGRQLEATTATANQVKLGEVVPELAGRFRRFPDYLTPPRRHFTNLREQWLEFHACIGPGSYQIDPGDVKIGDTPFSGLGENGSFQIFEPGADLSGVSTHEHWHTVDEVGGTANGTAGLEISADLANSKNIDPASYTFNGLSITRPEGEWPEGWGAGAGFFGVGTRVRIDYPRQYTVDIERIGDGDDPQYFRNTYTGYFGHVNVAQLTKTHAGTTYYGTVIGGSGDATIIGYWSDDNNRWYDEDPEGTSIQSLGAQNLWSITDILGDTITVSGSGVFQSAAVVSGAKVTFASGVFGEWTSAIKSTPAKEKTNIIEVDFFFPGGLTYIEDDGDLSSQSVTVDIRYRDAGIGGAWSGLRKTYTAATLDQIGYTEQIPVDNISPEVQIRRYGANSTSTQVQDKVMWYGLRSKLPTRTSYPNWTTVSIKIRSGGKIGANSENQISLVATRKLPTLQPDGTWSAPQATRDISSFVRYIAHSIGYTDDDLDMTELQRLHNIWVARGETMDHVFELTTVKNALSTVLAAGMSELTIADGQIRPVRDDLRTQFEAGYSPQNMTGPLRRTFRARRHDDPDGVEVEYVDSESWTQQTVICALPDSQLLKLEKLRLQGVTDRTRAWRIGMRRARQIRYRNWEYSFETEMDALNSEYLSYVPLLDDVPGYGQSALLTHIESAGSDAVLIVSEPIDWQDGENHVVAYRKPDGTIAGPWPAMPGDDDYSIVAPISAAERPVVSLKMELPHVYIGTTERWSFPALITAINPRGTDGANVSAVNYSAEIYADDDNYPSN